MYARMHVNVKPMSITIGEVIHGLNIMKYMDSDIMYVIHVYNDIWNATKVIAFFVKKLPKLNILSVIAID